MENKNNLVMIVIILIVIIGAAGLVLLNKSDNPQPLGNTDLSNVNVTGIVLYYSTTCPHCINVENFISQNDIKNKVDFTQKEVGANEANANEMLALAQKCNLASGDVGIPFLWNDGKCLMGDTDIINFFKQKAGIN